MGAHCRGKVGVYPCLITETKQLENTVKCLFILHHKLISKTHDVIHLMMSQLIKICAPLILAERATKKEPKEIYSIVGKGHKTKSKKANGDYSR